MLNKANYIIRIYNLCLNKPIDIDSMDRPAVKLFVETVPDNLDELLKEHDGDWATVNKIQH